MALIFIILSIIFFFGTHIEKLINELLVKCKLSFGLSKIEITEEIDTYWKMLSNEDRKWSIKEEENVRGVCGMSILTDD